MKKDIKHLNFEQLKRILSKESYIFRGDVEPIAEILCHYSLNGMGCISNAIKNIIKETKAANK